MRQRLAFLPKGTIFLSLANRTTDGDKRIYPDILPASLGKSATEYLPQTAFEERISPLQGIISLESVDKSHMRLALDA